jgi:hypothetical protein
MDCHIAMLNVNFPHKEMFTGGTLRDEVMALSYLVNAEQKEI